MKKNEKKEEKKREKGKRKKEKGKRRRKGEKGKRRKETIYFFTRFIAINTPPAAKIVQKRYS
jgi:hypothetical protein